MEYRNIAIIAHVDHGKTTLVDGMLKQTLKLGHGEEIAELRWVTREQLRRTSEVGELLLPGRISIARSLIEHWNGSPLTGAEW